ncbi:MAG: ATP-binding protein [Bryobacteraceae bacterium]
MSTFAPELASLANAVPPSTSFLPPVPQHLDHTGLTPSMLEALILKKIYYQGEIIGRDLASALGLYYSLIDPIVDNLKRHRMLEVKGSLGFGNISAVFALSEAGRSRTRECLDENQYSGVAPVPMAQYADGVRAQRSPNGWLTQEALAAAYRHMVVSPAVLAQIGPAVNSGKSFLIYGQPGNGKTYMAEALFAVNSSPVFVPYAIEYQGMIVQIFDPVYHQLVEGVSTASTTSISAASEYDRRWALCRRPFLVTGGELNLNMLDLGFSPVSKVYDAPFQLKANNGIYLIDDFGRQKASPAEVLNRWIVPMDRRVDYLTFLNGGKVQVPFETFLIFSTNLKPEQLGDEAFLRRIQYKMLLKSPGEEEFTEIFQRCCAAENLPLADGMLPRFLWKHYRKTGKRLRRCQPRDIISHAIDLIHFERAPKDLTEDILERAFESCFVNTMEDE